MAAVCSARAVVAAPAGGGVVELGARPVVTELPGVRDILYILYMYPKNRERKEFN